MDRGVTIENPYASVSIPRAQLKDGFLKYYLGEDQAPGTVFCNPSSLPSYPTAQEKVQPEATDHHLHQASASASAASYSPKVPTRESWARPFNPYASLQMPSGASPEPFHWKSHPGAFPESSGGRVGRGGGGCCCCCPCCRKCSPCCKRCPCVVS
ncbi:cysteine-rich tail protein 1 [Sceloporus undulatus]|uniref:cysteine-rich tail protein 1 n=1 Tax=Sceloporus undulatus TaxID=8520 RepID=UPI001C4CFBD9|nr:cysteine-rich tail protein 1 [Sceloporus undulatus]